MRVIGSTWQGGIYPEPCSQSRACGSTGEAFTLDWLEAEGIIEGQVETRGSLVVKGCDRSSSPWSKRPQESAGRRTRFYKSPNSCLGRHLAEPASGKEGPV